MSSTTEILAKLEEFSSKFEKINTMETSLELLSSKYDELLKTCNSLKKEVNSLKIENKSLKAEIVASKEKITLNANDINDLEQYSRRDCLEIRGIPQYKDEDTDDLVKKVGELIDVNLRYDDISVSHRLSNGIQTRDDGVQIKRVPSIIVKFTKRSDRDEFYQARKHLKGKTTRDMGFTRQPSQPIYISESLTRKNKDIFNTCLKAKKEFGFKFIWTNYGKTCLRKNSDSPVISIKSLDDLRKHKLEVS
jgi:regulator of replication initiation timing